jgi:hypothetical protein
VAPCGSAQDRFAFLAWNPGAALSLLPAGFVVRSILPVVLFNLEAGAAFGGGFVANHQSLEGRIAIGNSNATYFLAQTQVSWNWFFGETAGWTARGGPYAGAALRAWDLVQLSSHVHSWNLAPLVDVGWWFDAGGWFIDARLSQVFLVVSGSSIPGSIPGAQFLFSPLPGVSPWMPIGLVQIGIKL